MKESKWKLPADEMRLVIHSHPEEIQIRAYKQMRGDLIDCLNEMQEVAEALKRNRFYQTAEGVEAFLNKFRSLK